MLIYNLIPKGALPPLTTPTVYGFLPQRRLSINRGFTKGSLRAGGTRSATDRAGRRDGLPPPFGIKLYNFLPLPYRKTIDYRLVNLREGVSERRWRSAANRSTLPLRSALNGRHWRPAPEPAGEKTLGPLWN